MLLMAAAAMPSPAQQGGVEAEGGKPDERAGRQGGPVHCGIPSCAEPEDSALPAPLHQRQGRGHARAATQTICQNHLRASRHRPIHVACDIRANLP